MLLYQFVIYLVIVDPFFHLQYPFVHTTFFHVHCPFAAHEWLETSEVSPVCVIWLPIIPTFISHIPVSFLLILIFRS
jgi:hypothetical protein